MDASNVSSAQLKALASVKEKVARYLPEPSVKGSGMFRDVMSLAKTVSSSLVGGVPTSLDGGFSELLELQIQAQKEMQSTTMLSNVEKSKHESKMAAIRNIRVG